MKIDLVYVEQNSIDRYELNASILDNSMDISLSFIDGENKDVICKQIVENPVLHDHFPNMILQCLMCAEKESIDFGKIKVLNLDYPEQKIRFNAQTGQLEEILTEEEKDIKKQIGGSL
jgi:hypothetical protein